MVNSLRGRLTLWYVGAFSVVLVLFSFGVHYLVSGLLYQRLDTNLRSTLQVTALAVSGFKPISDAASPVEALIDPGLPNQLLALLDSHGKLLATRPVGSRFPLRIPTLSPVDSPQFYQLPESSLDANDSCRGVYQRVSNGSTGTNYFVVVQMSDELVSDQLDTLQNVLIGAVLLALVVTGSGGWFLARRNLAPLATMAAATERITASNLAERLPIMNPHDEIGRLASQFNNLLTRLENAFEQQHQFMADASHELRSPLSIVRTSAQVALQRRHREESDYRECLDLVERQTARLTRIVEDMFALTRADMGQLPLALADFYLDELMNEVVLSAKVLADHKGVKLDSCCAEEALYRGDENLLRRMVINLLDNAIKYTSSGGCVGLSLKRLAAGYELTIADSGCGIPADLVPHIFERFCRADRARSNQNGSDGAGLGLSIARSIARLHGGELTLINSSSLGTTFAVSLPAQPQDVSTRR